MNFEPFKPYEQKTLQIFGNWVKRMIKKNIQNLPRSKIKFPLFSLLLENLLFYEAYKPNIRFILL